MVAKIEVEKGELVATACGAVARTEVGSEEQKISTTSQTWKGGLVESVPLFLIENI